MADTCRGNSLLSWILMMCAKYEERRQHLDNDYCQFCGCRYLFMCKCITTILSKMEKGSIAIYRKANEARSKISGKEFEDNWSQNKLPMDVGYIGYCIY